VNNKEDVASSVANIIARVRAEGDIALLYCTEIYDGFKLNSIKVICKNGNTKIKDVIDNAYKRIRQFHELQTPRNVEYNGDGIKAWLPIDNVGLYIPGGTAPLISTLLMLAVPAKLAGCKNIVCVTPPNRSGGIDTAILYAAELCGIEHVYSIGGTQAIAALAYGTETVPKVEKVFGPGNKYVTEAKIHV
jgi:histidinol dehydrogenase